MTEREQLSAVDAAWYQMDEPGNAADISVLFEFDGSLDYDDLLETLRSRLVGRYPRFKQRVVRRGPSLYWEDDPDFDLGRHVGVVTGDDASREGLRDLVSDLVSAELPEGRPPWQMFLVEREGGDNVLVARIHHCMGDGFGLGAALLRTAEVSPDGESAVGSEPKPREHESLRDLIVHEAHELRRRPERAVELAKKAGGLAATLGHILLLGFDPDTSLHGELSGVRRVAWTQSIDLERIKAVGRRMSATVNDVLLTAMSGALRRWLDEVDDAGDLDIRAMVPVNLRPARSLEEVSEDLGNRFGLVMLDLWTSEVDPVQRLAKLKESMDALKASPEAVLAFGILNAVGKTPAVIEHIVTHIFARKASVVVTNVPGPRERLFLAGTPIKNVVFWVPHPARFGLGLSIISYAGEVRVGVRSDAAVVDDPSRVAELFEREFEALEKTASAS